MPTIWIENSKDEKYLIMQYEPTRSYTIEGIFKHLNDEDKDKQWCNIKNTFRITKNDLINPDEQDFISVYIAELDNNYYRLYKHIFCTKHDIYFHKDMISKLGERHFCASRNVSIIRKFDEALNSDIYIDNKVNVNDENHIEYKVFNNIVKNFPKQAELDKYVENRIASVLSEYYPDALIHKEIYDDYISKKSKRIREEVNIKTKDYNDDIRIDQLEDAIKEIEELLDKESSEDEFQYKLIRIIKLLYPKYLLYKSKPRFKGLDKNGKSPDFVLVDPNGYIDILEIKKADVKVISSKPNYRNNYVALRELHGGIQQIQKYIDCLYNLDKDDKFLKDLDKELPEGVNAKVVNPKGMFIGGRSNNFNNGQIRDFELIKRQYSNIIDIFTYDDLIHRLKTIKESLEIRENI